LIKLVGILRLCGYLWPQAGKCPCFLTRNIAASIPGKYVKLESPPQVRDRNYAPTEPFLIKAAILVRMHRLCENSELAEERLISTEFLRLVRPVTDAKRRKSAENINCRSVG
jgi:hypothetical protein